MTDEPAPGPAPAANTPSDTNATTPADRIAKVMARAGVASRREAERMIVEGRVTVNGQTIASPALDVRPGDRITVDGKPLDEPQETRLWLYYKPVGLVSSDADEKGRQTIFDALPRDLPRVMTVGRLDLTSEGLLLLTNDGALKRRLELPSTGWLRRYRVRVNGTPGDMTFAPLRRGVTIDGEEFAPMEISLDSQQGANAWLTVGIREGKNREIRRAMTHVGLQVNRLIRIGYGPFKLTGMEKNEVVEVKRRVLRDQLGGLLTGEDDSPKPRALRPRGAAGPRRDGADDARPARNLDGPRTVGAGRPRADRPGKPRADAPDGESRPRFPRKAEAGDASRPRFPRKAEALAEEGDRPWRSRAGKPPRAESVGDRPRSARTDARPDDRAPFGGDKDAKPRRRGPEQPPEGKPRGRGDGFAPRAKGGPAGDRTNRFGGERSNDGRDAAQGETKPAWKRPAGDAPKGVKRGGKPGGPRPAAGGPGGKPRPGGAPRAPSGNRPGASGTGGGKPGGGRPGGRPGPRPQR